MKVYKFLIFIAALMISCSENTPEVNSVPRISFTFDDGITSDLAGYPFEDWNAMILEALDSHHLKAVFFVTGYNKQDEKGKQLLQSWDEKGHHIANHTFTHPNYHDPKTSFEDFKWEFLKNDSLIQSYQNYSQFFRFPYLKEGNTRGKIDSFRTLLETHSYQNGYVTIDASDWYINGRLIKRLKENPDADIKGFRQYYLDHLYDRAVFYEKLAYDLTGRHIAHTILLHHNLSSALFLDDLIQHFKEKEWEVLDANLAFQDAIFKKSPFNLPAGESLIWAMAKTTGKYENILRYPAEDSRYEVVKMDSLGL